MVIWDLFMFYDELDMLECRLYELENLPVRHVITEATRDHYGRPKPLWFCENRERFAPWADRIVSNVVMGLSPEGGVPEYHTDTDPWLRLHAQRNAQVAGLTGASDQDIVLISDVDEIPSPAACVLPPAPGGHMLEQRLYLHAVDWQYPVNHFGTMAIRRGELARTTPMELLGRRIEAAGENQLPVVPDGGWHLSWLGWPDNVQRKVTVQAHLERPAFVLEDFVSGRFYREGVHEAWYSGDVLQEGVRLAPVDVDETWPRWVSERKCPESWFRPR